MSSGPQVDVLVAGSGASGLLAALAAADAGAGVLILERSAWPGGTSALSGGRVWVPANHCPENAGDTREAARAYLDGLFPERYAYMTEAFLANAPVMARFVEARSPHRFVACPNYPDYHPGRAGATLGGRCLDMLPTDLAAMAPLAREARTPAGYLPMTHAEWERWRYPGRFDRDLLSQRDRAGVRTGGAGLVAALIGAATVERAGTRLRIGVRSVILATGGFDWDSDLRRDWHPVPQRATGAPPGNTGDGLRIALRLDAAVDNLAEGCGCRCWPSPARNSTAGRPSGR